MATLARPAQLPLEVLDIGNPHLWTEYSHVLPYFAEMRRAGPVHWCPESMYGPYWNIVSHQHIMEVEGRPDDEGYYSYGLAGGAEAPAKGGGA